MTIKNVTVAGTGVLGSQIAFQIAFKGFNVTVYDIDAAILTQAKAKLANLKTIYKKELTKTKKQFGQSSAHLTYNANLLPALNQNIETVIQQSAHAIETAPERLHYTASLEQAAAEADLVIEAIPEKITIKQAFYQQLAPLAPAKTIFATNSSTLVPSQFAAATGRPKRFLALHFANEIWKNNTAEIMGHADTDPKIFQEVVAFASSIGMIPIPVKKEQPGYILNSILVPFLDAAQLLYLNGVGDIETIDKTWMLATGAAQGPFGMMDVIGIVTVYNIIKNFAATTGAEKYTQLAKLLKANYLDQGKLGASSGEGFYRYPNPAYQQPGFLS
ncbi:3-hydroxyacyl-CoA dehydrogenase [Loigolactobacillus rennini]|uniref:3-hydroxybutyryl-CoA dehydrogenase n=2 Tax=Loigolactobacillus rennini TaxID=238013 RepID=A0A0R2D7F8_9LACO|nr:3-hydroxyacyl-CoA dehydrogenase [Loigolactobacillus rennini]KRM99314.1 3-hydroxybutyryl-CoA dehydrogenase [Loigolactobacillus rennini DSM 20253]SFZ89036.1 3-hydroxybutyryl-CoA dehydrogenase; 3-hydroxyacyl-CoA dehydrogenase [Loigolactobacillus rennini]